MDNGIERYSRLITEEGETFGEKGEYTAPKGALYSTYGNIGKSRNSGSGSTPRFNLQSRSSGYNYYSFGISRSFLKEERLSLNAYCINVFSEYRTYDSRTEGTNFMSRSSSKYSNRHFGVSVSYRIGKLQASVKKATRSINNDDVKSGGGGNSGDGGK